jgi:hypothetical protein
VAASISVENKVSMLEIIANTKDGDDVIKALTTNPEKDLFLTKDTITIDGYQGLIELLMAEVDERGREENGEESVEKGSYTIIDPDQKLYKFLRGYHEKVQQEEKKRAEESGFDYFIRRLGEAPRSYSRNPKLGKSSHYKKCPDQYGIDFRDKQGKLKSILPTDTGRPRMTHLLFGDLTPTLAYGQTPAVFLKMETVGIGKIDEKLKHLLNFVKSRPPVQWVVKSYNSIVTGISDFFREKGSAEVDVNSGEGSVKKSKVRSNRKESYVDKKIRKEYKRILKDFELNKSMIDASYHEKLLKAIKSNPQSIQLMLRNLMLFEKLSKSKKGKRYFRKRIKHFKWKVEKIKGYKKDTLSYRHGDEVILDLRSPVSDVESKKNNMEDRVERIIQFFGENKNVGFVKSALTNTPINEYHKKISEKLGLVYNVIRMKDKDGVEFLVEIREKLGLGGFGTAYKAVVISGENKGKVFALKQQRLPSLARENFFSRLKQVIKRPFMEAPDEEMETSLLKSQGMFLGDAYINYKGDKKGLVAEGIEAKPDPRVHQLGAEKTQSRYFVLQPLMDGGDFSHLHSNRGKEGERSWNTLTIEESTALVSSAISSVLTLHKSGYAHNDLHHENIMTTKDPAKAYVMDFGRATKENIDEHGYKKDSFSKAQIADIHMMMNGKPGKDGSLNDVFEKMIVRIRESNLGSKKEDEAIQILSMTQNHVLRIKEGDDIQSQQELIEGLFKRLDEILKPNVPSIQAEPAEGPDNRL